METFGARLYTLRKMSSETQQDLAERLHVSPQTVSLWETDTNMPDVGRMREIADTFGVSLAWLLGEGGLSEGEKKITENLQDRLFQEDRMYTNVKSFAAANEMYQTMRALPFAREAHEGAVRKGVSRVPYIYHPLLLACHAIALGIATDDLLSVCILHDVVEDTKETFETLPVNDTVREAVRLLTKPVGFDKSDEAEAAYYEAISKNGIASMVKLLDRCQNVSSMANGLKRERVSGYILETEKWIYPLFETTGDRFPEYYHALFNVKYHMKSVIEAIRHWTAKMSAGEGKMSA